MGFCLDYALILKVIHSFYRRLCCWYVPLFNSFIGLRDFLAFKYINSCQLKSSARLDTKCVCIFYPILAIQTVKWCYIHTLLKRQGIGNFFLDFPKTTIESDRFFYKKKKEEIGNSLTQDNDNTGVVLKELQLCWSAQKQCKLVMPQVIYKHHCNYSQTWK